MLKKDVTGTVLQVCGALLGDQSLFEDHGYTLTRIGERL
jgi:hypothetical protein